MGSDIKMWDEEIQEALDWVEDTLGGMQKVKEAERPKKVYLECHKYFFPFIL